MMPLKPVALIARLESGQIRISRHVSMPHANDALRRLQQKQALGWAVIDAPLYTTVQPLSQSIAINTAAGAKKRHQRLLGRRAQPELSVAGGGGLIQ